MGTVVAIESEGVVAIAGDTRTVEDGTVTSRQNVRVFDLGSVGVGIVGEPGDVQAFKRQFESELQTERIERGNDIGVDELARIAARHARDVAVEVVVAARDPDGAARVRQVGADGHVLEGPAIAIGSGAEIAYGQLESAGAGLDADEVASTAREVVETVVRRDADTGGDVHVWTIGDGAVEVDDGQ